MGTLWVPIFFTHLQNLVPPRRIESALSTSEASAEEVRPQRGF
jgi:hypothetical protein